MNGTITRLNKHFFRKALYELDLQLWLGSKQHSKEFQVFFQSEIQSFIIVNNSYRALHTVI
jgi:hypothetical protein